MTTEFLPAPTRREDLLDTAARGLSVMLLESHDFAKGTSSRATKLVHGGVRYLALGHIALVREALRESAPRCWPMRSTWRSRCRL